MKVHFKDSGSIKSLLHEALLCTVQTQKDDRHDLPCSLILCAHSIKRFVESAALDLFTSSKVSDDVEPNRVVIKYFLNRSAKEIKTQVSLFDQVKSLSLSPQDALLELDDSASKFSFLGVIGLEAQETSLRDGRHVTTVKNGKDYNTAKSDTISTISVDLQMLSSLLCLIAHAPTIHFTKNLHLCFPLIHKQQAAKMPRLLTLLSMYAAV